LFSEAKETHFYTVQSFTNFMLIGADGEIKLRVFLDVIDTGEGPLPRDGYG
jgi:hypothetical protein